MTKLLKDLPVGAKVKDLDTKYYGEPIEWIIVDKNHAGYPSNSVTLMADKIICFKMYDAVETKNDSGWPIGNPYYELSNIRQWLNSDQRYWYYSTHTGDKPPTYESEAGFLTNFSKGFKEKLLTTPVDSHKWDMSRSGEKNRSLGNKKLNDKVFLGSTDEIGVDKDEYDGSYREGSRLQYFDNDVKRIGVPTNAAAMKAGKSVGKAAEYSLRTQATHYLTLITTVSTQGRAGRTVNASDDSIGVRPFVNVKNDVMVKDTQVNGVYEITWNQPPTKPGSFTLPIKITSRTATTISWSKSTDPEGDPISYKLERSLDGGAFVQRYKGSLTSYKDTIEDKGHTSVVYRVTAIDSNGNVSPSLTSASVPVSDNTIPTIETASTDLGKITSGFSVAYKVVDPDSGQTWTVTEKLDGKVLKTFSAKVGTSYTCKMSASEWQKVLNGKHSITIEVKDSEGGSSSKTISFEKAVSKLDFMLDKTGLQGVDKMPERAILSMSANVPAEASIKIEITNNALDDKPVWQDCTSQVLGNEKIFFSNKKKTASKWAVNVRVIGDKKTATDVLSVSVIGGFYD